MCLQRRSLDVAGCRDVLQDRGKQGGEIFAVGHLAVARRGQRRATRLGRGVDDWKVEAVTAVIVQQIQKEIVGLLHHICDSSIVAIDLVHHQDDRQLLSQSLTEHEAGLGKRPLGGVHKEQYPIDHFQATLNLATEVGVARRVNDVDGDNRTVGQPVPYGGVLGEEVMPFSRSRSIESITRFWTAWPTRNAPDCHSIASTRVVLPWSTSATIATFRRSERTGTQNTLFRLGGQPGESMAGSKAGRFVLWPLAHQRAIPGARSLHPYACPMAGSTDWFRDSFRTEYEKQNAAIGRFNLAIFGKTGVGKSTLINAIFGEEVARTGIGEPVTRGSHLYLDKVGHLGIVDTQGLEVGKDNKQILSELDKAMTQMRQLPLSEQIHVAWYCLRGIDRRFEEAEADFVRRLDGMGVPVIVVLTQVPMRDGYFHPDAVLLAEQIIAKNCRSLRGGSS